MPEAPDLDALVSLWQRARDEGREPPLEELCADCPELAVELGRRLDVLRRIEVWSQERAAGQGTLRDTPDGPPTFPQPDPPPPAPLLAAGPPGYELLGVLGRGGMGIVYRARQAGLNRVVALKMILGGAHAGDEERVRFLAEAEVVAGLRHPGIVQVHEFGYFEGIPYFALEFCAGGSLEGRLQGKPLPHTTAAALLLRITEAMQYAHSSGIIHRDLKPGNILLRAATPVPPSQAAPPDATVGDLDPLITDFGLARRIEGAPGLTRPGAVMGTPSYMSPEQARGGDVGPATDIYALGAIFYELLTGRPPFQGATPQETLAQLAMLEAVPVRRLNPNVPADLETICLKCLEKESRKRYASCRELADDLGRWQRGEPILARPIGLIDRLWRWCRRNPVVAGLAGALATLTLLAMVAITLLWRDAASARDRAIAQEKLTLKERDAAREEHHRTEVLLYASQLALAQREIERGNLAVARRHLDACRWDLRGWEHRLLHTSLLAGQVRLEGHDAGVTALGLSPDGRLVLTGGQDRTARLWDTRTGEARLVLACQAAASAAALTGPLAVIGTRDGMLKGWDANTGKELFSTQAHKNAVTGAVCSPDGRLLYTSGADQSLQVRELPSGRLLHELPGAKDSLTCLAASADGRQVAAGEEGGMVRVWDVATRRERITFQAGESRVASIAFSPDGKLIAIGVNWDVRLWDAGTGGLVRVMHGHRNSVASVSFCPDGTRLLSASFDDTVRIWDAGGRPIRTVEMVAWGIGAAAWCPSTRLLWCGGSDGTLRSLDAWWASPQPRRHEREVAALAWSEGGLASFSWDGTIRVGKSVLHGTAGQVPSLAWVGGHLFSGGSEHDIRMWDIGSRKARILAGHQGGVTGLATLPPGTLASCSTDGTVRLWDAATGSAGRELASGEGDLAAVACSHDGKLVAAAGESGTIVVWDVVTGEVTRRLRGHTAAVRCLAFAPHGGVLASGAADHAVVLWDVHRGKLNRVLEGHASPVNSVAWTPDGSRLLAADEDGHLAVWEPATGLRLLSEQAHEKMSATCLAFGPDGVLASGGFDRAVRLWDARHGMAQLALQRHGTPLARLSLAAGGLIVGTDQMGQRVAWSAITGRQVETPEDTEPIQDGRLRAWITAEGSPRVEDLGAARANAALARSRLSRLAGADPAWHAARAVEEMRALRWQAARYHLWSLLRDD